VEVTGDDPARRRVDEALLTVADGRFGTRGTREEDGTGYDPLVMAAGVYALPDGDTPRPLPGPLWYAVDLDPENTSSERRWLDLRSGVLYRQGAGPSGIRTLRFACLARPTTMVSRVEVAGRLESGDALMVPPSEGDRAGRGTPNGTQVVRVVGQGSIVGAFTTELRDDGGRSVLDRIAVLAADPRARLSTAGLRSQLTVVRHAGIDQLLAEQQQAWDDRWEEAQVSIDGDPELELAVRFALFHLMSSVADDGEAAVGARGLSGTAYAGHVFWDADVFVLPFLAATHPTAARAMLEYRVARLPAAQLRARQLGLAGARFPWESAADGTEATPPTTIGLEGAVQPVRTGELEEHIVADVAWAAWHYASWSGDRRFWSGSGRRLLVETARYWASRVEIDPDGTGHIRGVIGPDEYHEEVDDNAYTNVMARWNLRCGADVLGSPDPEAVRWRDLADRLVDGYDPRTGTYEQFDGFWQLERFDLSGLAVPPVAADVLLGRERLSAVQVIKQADVLMLHHLVPDEVVEASLVPNLDAYLPLTAHGSSLSPAIHASLLARAGRPEQALAWLDLAARLDLDDHTGTTAGGLHLATMGGVWQALAFGFLGLRPHTEALGLHPQALPDGWDGLEVRLRFHGHRVVLHHRHDHVDVDGEGRVPLIVAGRPARHLRSPVRLRRRADGWTPEDPR
jgi:trehalose/maltose hydrolase-like predicted phosphorylase